MDHRPSDLDPYPRAGRDLATHELWAQSLERSRQRRRLNEASRSNRQRRKGTSLAVGAAMLASPVMPAFAGGRGDTRGGPAASALDTSSLAAATGGLTELLRFGDVGPAVAAIQRQVDVVDDGIFGPVTKAGVERFQRANGLTVTGTVDARTWATMFNGRVLFYDAPGSAATAPVTATQRPAIQRAAIRLVVNGGDEPGASGAPAAPSAGDGQITVPEGPSPRRGRAGDPSPAGPGTEGDAPAPPSAPGNDGTTPTPPAEPAPPAPAPPPGGSGCTDGTATTPVSGTITSRFGENRGTHRHTGLDIAARSGTPIRAAQCGTVIQSGAESGYGLMVCVRHAGDTTTCYAHMSRTQASVDEQVQAGQTIGYVGCTGNCTGPHVHFEVRRNGTPVDPEPYLSGQQTVAGTTGTVTAASLRRTPTSSAGTSSGAASATVAAARAGTSPAAGASAAAPAAVQPAPVPVAEQSAPAAAQAPVAEQSAPAPAPVAEQSAPAAAPVAEESAPAPAPAPEQSAPAPAPAPEQSVPAQAPAPEQSAPAPEQSAPAAEQSAPAAAPVAEESAPAPAPAPEQSAPAPAPAPEQSAPAPAPAPEQSVPAPEQSAPAAAQAPAAEQPAPAPAQAPTPEQSAPATGGEEA